MKIIKKILIAIAALVALFLIAALILPDAYHVKREVTIQTPKDTLFNYLKNLKNQDDFSVWNKMDPNMKKSFKGTDGTVGAVSSWKSDSANVGSGEQEIINIADGQRIDFELRFFEPWQSTDYAYFTTEAVDSAHTKVTWGFNGKMPYPWNVMLLTMDMDEMLGKDLEQGLQNLKSEMER
ncbi:MAG: polyketide cyclase [Calditrichaeota bacterium]|nr:MAG: polyketide cyclase [Calditrichota bacterium]